jgi:hypothetical protein
LRKERAVTRAREKIDLILGSSTTPAGSAGPRSVVWITRRGPTVVARQAACSGSAGRFTRLGE